MSFLCECIETAAPPPAARPLPCPAERDRISGAVAPSALPQLKSGQLWVVEFSSGAALSSLERHALTSANVIIYDRALAPDIAAMLPLGGYAEAAASEDAAAAAARPSERCVGFALDGWRVVRAIEAEQAPSLRAERLRRLAHHLLARRASGELPVRLIDAASGSLDTTLDGLIDLLAAPTDRCMIVFGGIGTIAAPHLHAVSCNGLAG